MTEGTIMAPLHNISETCSVWLKFAVHFLSVQPTEKKLTSKYRRQNKDYGSIVYLKSLNYTTHICICTENWWVLLFLSWKPVSIQVEMSALYFKLDVGRRYSLVEFSNTFLFIQFISLLLYTKAVFPLVPNKVHNIIRLSEVALFLHHRVNKKWKMFFFQVFTDSWLLEKQTFFLG